MLNKDVLVYGGATLSGDVAYNLALRLKVRDMLINMNWMTK